MQKLYTQAGGFKKMIKAATNYPLITIGIACYKSPDTVGRAVKSALEQDWPNIELLIVDDGSGDETASVSREAIKDHDNARLLIHEQNKGFAGALNTIIREAKGEFLAIFDDDDFSLPNRLSRQYERITVYEKKYRPELVVCHAARIQHYPDGYERYESTMGTDESGIAPRGLDVVDRILMGRLSKNVVGSCANCSRMARIELFRMMNGYDVTMRRAEDTDFNIRLGLAGGHFVGIAEPLVLQTMTMGQEKTLKNEKAAEFLLLEKHRAYLESKGWYDFCLGWLEARYEHLSNHRAELVRRLARLAVCHPAKVLRKIFWIIPAHNTRRDFKRWHHERY